jgi:hypothetical protein
MVHTENWGLSWMDGLGMTTLNVLMMANLRQFGSSLGRENGHKYRAFNYLTKISFSLQVQPAPDPASISSTRRHNTIFKASETRRYP